MEFKSIRSRLTLWFFIAALAPLTVVTYVTYEQRAESIKAEAFSKLIAIRDLKVSQVEAWLAERRGDISLLAAEPEIKRFADTIESKKLNRQNSEWAAVVRDTLNARIRNYTVYSELFLISAQTGKVVLSTRENSEGEDKSENTFFTTPMQTKSLFIKDIHYSKQLNRPTLTISVPIFSPHNKNKITSIVVAKLNLDQSLYALLLDRPGMGTTGETLIVNKDVVALNELRWHENAPLNLTINAVPAVQASHGRSGIVETVDYRGKMVLAAYTYIPGPGWGFVAKQYQSEIYEPIGELLKSCVIIYVISIVAVYLVSLLVARTITRPLVSLVKITSQLGNGELSVRSNFPQGDEVGSLSSAFDKMADALSLRINTQENISEIMALVVKTVEVNNFADDVLQMIVALTSSELGSFYLLEPDKDQFDPIASRGCKNQLLEPIDNTKLEGELGRAIALGRTNHIKEIPVDMFSRCNIFTGDALPNEIITVPLTAQGKTVAVLSLGTMRNYTPDHLEVINNLLPTLTTGLASLLANAKIRDLADDLKDANNALEFKKEELQYRSEELQKQNVELITQRKKVEERTIELEVRVGESEQLNKAMVNLLEDLQDNQKQLEVTSELLTSSNKELEGFAYSVSHDLRAPLRHMSGFTSLLEKHAANSFDDKSKHYIDIIKNSSEKMGQLIDDLLHYSRTGRAEMQKQTVNSEELVHEVIKELEAYDKERQVDWQVDQLPPALADPALLRIIWINLLANAVKFTGNKDKAIIEIGSRPGEKDETVYFVKDNGAGFDMKYQNKLFGVFQRLHHDSEFAGTGIGLATVQRIIHRHSGRIWAEGVIDEGATFFFTLP